MRMCNTVKNTEIFLLEYFISLTINLLLNEALVYNIHSSRGEYVKLFLNHTAHVNQSNGT